MSKRIGTDQFFRIIDTNLLAKLNEKDQIICADCAHKDCDSCKFQDKCAHVHYWEKWGSVAQIEEANPNLRWNPSYGMWEDCAAS